MAIAIYLEPERTPSRYPHVAQPQILVDEIHVVVQAFTIVWLQVCLVRLLVMPRLVATTGLHRGQNAHQSRLFSTLVQHLFDPFLLAELLLTSNKFDLDSVFVSDTLHVLPNGLAQRLCPLRVVENADLVLVEAVRHALGVAPLWNRPLDDDPVVAGKNASDLALVPLGQEFDAHSGIITDILFGSGYAGLGLGNTPGGPPPCVEITCISTLSANAEFARLIYFGRRHQRRTELLRAAVGVQAL